MRGDGLKDVRTPRETKRGRGVERMNILFFLTPKSEVAYINEDDTIRQALEKMEYHKYSAVPIISKTGRYVGTLTEGDLLWGIKNQFNLDLKGAEKIPVTAVRRKSDNRPVKAGEDMEDLIGKALNQNFVPVLDDQKCFIGIITRKARISRKIRRKPRKKAGCPESPLYCRGIRRWYFKDKGRDCNKGRSCFVYVRLGINAKRAIVHRFFTIRS